MNEATLDLLLDVVGRLERNIAARRCPAVCGLDGDRRLTLTGYDYLRDDATAGAFERRAAAQANRVRARRWVLAVPMIIAVPPGAGLHGRPVSNQGPREGEQEAIVWTAFDHDDGIDYGIVAYTRRPDGSPVYHDPEIFTAPLAGTPAAPGSVLRQTLLNDPS
ncbi:hypothetical protein DZF91_33385 [Actinomadura logoneensis]|uniref:Uncharacterized protein n=1 Tax=Actinomadura logoneensis TaxID=2293572 RepID=A0A372JBJ3_9ACTN|nr:hypothetical protein [Actinomadura logoneensis]RFU37340.1 hypothetical protein DZF91_33385 [Actinomadura logoneensis]